MRIDSLPGEVYDGRVVEIANRDLKVLPRELASGANLARRVDREGTARPASITYQVRVQLTHQPAAALLGSPGEAQDPCGTTIA